MNLEYLELGKLKGRNLGWNLSFAGGRERRPKLTACSGDVSAVPPLGSSKTGWLFIGSCTHDLLCTKGNLAFAETCSTQSGALPIRMTSAKALSIVKYCSVHL